MECSSILRRTPALATAALLLSSHVPNAQAALLAHFDFEDAAGNFTTAADDVAANLSISDWLDTDGTLRSVNNAPGFALSARSFHDGNQLRLTLAPATGFALELAAIEFEHSATSTGPTAWHLSLASTPISAGTTATTFKTEHVAFGALRFGGPLELILEANGASSSLGAWRIDNFALQGTLQPAVSAVPVPAAGWLFGGGLLALTQRRRVLGSPA